MLKSFIIFVLAILAIHSNCEEDLLQLGQDVGFTTEKYPEVTDEALVRIRREAYAGKKDAQYLFGLMLFYGHRTIKDQTLGIQFFQKAAEQGHKEALFAAGMVFSTGNGLPEPNNKLAMSYFKRGSAHGHVDSMVMEGRMLLEGIGGNSDQEAAAELFQRAFAVNNIEAAYSLGTCYEYGLGVTQDFTKAAALFEVASQGRHLDGLYHLGLMYTQGRGVDRDLVAAVSLFKEAANRGHQRSQYYLAICFFHGEGVHVDYKMALMWFTKASDGDDPIRERALKAKEELTAAMLSSDENRRKVQQEIEEMNKPKEGQTYEEL
eukprot:TRINITY_DN775886_c0_g1_i1.p1 TRINITY_DN775886_c0_g1~~TRINITY_DN775886_c0_g1_i1.p1  ORF type:complete len:320 (-),score=73.20 TRINITY_DN775886_c0_g1_i1:86-1045(-)